ncbi:Long-chain-fatty-acid--CoA ligase [Symmachiella dynata]|uniref:fatty acid CoA ligase family protein n=1 Tax=Symmachiella dynata TaxID=2527995 RepID=UPI00118BC2A3|nr:fatty acid CoA ligase family protein [Symmachiella dynata]QDT49331.1 Long-chain-fatty-acid--CoA ligase [Symmachiella dynata]
MSTTALPPVQSGNIAAKVSAIAHRYPHQRAVVFPAGRDAQGRVMYSHLTFAQLEQETDRLARGLIEMGVQPGQRMVLFVPPSLEFIALTFALFKAGAVGVLIDPGMGIKNVFRCLNQVDPDGFIAVSLAQAARKLFSSKVPNARFNVTVGKRWFWGGPNYSDLLGGPWTPLDAPDTKSTDPAAIIFTSGSTGPAKGVLYEHGMFAAQVDDIRDFYDIQPGEIDLPGFPLFALFNSAMGVTTVIPDMDPSRPAQVDPKKIIEAINDQGVTQAFGSPAIWNAVSRYCVEQGVQFPTLKRVLSAGAPVPIAVIERMHQVFTSDDADIHTPYGATESLPVASISGRQVLAETAEQTRSGGGTCVGELFPGITVRVIEISYDPIPSYADVQELPTGEIGEIIVQGAVATREYFQRPDGTLAAKIPDGAGFWHRMGDVGYFDERGRLWFCGRKAHIVETPTGRMFSVRCEAIFNEHPRVFRSALVGVGERPQQKPVIIIEPEAGAYPEDESARKKFTAELAERAAGNPLTESIETILFHRALPVDVRHNVKISREKLSVWATQQLRATS